MNHLQDMQINTKKFLHFFSQYKNEWKEIKF